MKLKHTKKQMNFMTWEQKEKAIERERKKQNKQTSLEDYWK